MDLGVPSRMALWAIVIASSISSLITSTCFSARRRSARQRSTSTITPTPSFSVIANGCAPPISPSPAVTTSLPFSVPQPFCRASEPKVS